MPVTLLYVGNVAFALMSLQNLNIPMYNTLKRMTPVIVLVTKASLAGQPLQCTIRGVQGHAQKASLSMPVPGKIPAALWRVPWQEYSPVGSFNAFKRPDYGHLSRIWQAGQSSYKTALL